MLMPRLRGELFLSLSCPVLAPQRNFWMLSLFVWFLILANHARVSYLPDWFSKCLSMISSRQAWSLRGYLQLMDGPVGSVTSIGGRELYR